MSENKPSGDAALLPCPFCQQLMRFRAALWPSDGDCDAIIHDGHTECPMQVFSDETADNSIIGAWNTRAPSPDLTAAQARIEELGAALKPFADLARHYDPPEDDDDQRAWDTTYTPMLGDFRKARAALASTRETRS